MTTLYNDRVNVCICDKIYRSFCNLVVVTLMSVEESCSFSHETPDWAIGLKPCGAGAAE